ncbi:RAD16 [Sanghuangporus sanghuang]
MARATRAGTRTRARQRLETPPVSTAAGTATPSTTTTTTNADVSPIFSAKTSSVSLTPPTSDGEDGLDRNKVALATQPGEEATQELWGLTRRRSARTKNVSVPSTSRANGKRVKDESSEDELFLSNKKRRASGVRNKVYVEIPVRSVPPANASKQQTNGVKRKRGSGKCTPRISETPTPLNEREDEAVELVSEDEVEYDEEAELEESGDSGSEFEAFDDDDDGEEYEDTRKTRKSPRKSVVTPSEYEGPSLSDSEAEARLLELAIELSKQVAEEDEFLREGGASGSSASALRAAAAERRRARAQGIELESLPGLTESEAEATSADSDSDEEPLAKKGKGKGEASAKSNSGNNIMTFSELRARARAAGADLRAHMRELKAEEKRLRRELGRKLTHAEKTSIQLKHHHEELRSVWGDLETRIKPVKPLKAEQPEELKIQMLPFQLESLYWMREQEKGEWHGGMLADEMGMGKTIQTLALIASDGNRPNLVVAPTVAIMQWRNEIEAYTDGLRIAIWHGAAREANAKELMKYDVVLTTYSVLESAFRKQQSGFKRGGKIVKEKSPVHQIHWTRIILDEAHNIKERSTNTAKATFELQSTYKWCLSGTPLQNRVGELYSLVRFLGGDPFSFYFCKRCDCKSLHWKFTDKKTCDDCGHSPMQHTCFWNNEILTPIQKHGMSDAGSEAFKKLRILLDRMMLRRTKIERADDLGLPPRTVIVRRDFFSDEEKELYLSLFTDAKRQFSTYVDQGSLLNNYSNIFSLITRMRQMACHPDLVLKSKRNAKTFSSDVEEATVCRLCNDIAEDAIQSRCRHIFDRECIKQYINTAVEQVPACPVCHVSLTIDLDAPALEVNEDIATARQGILGRLDIDKWRSSTKIEALVEELTNLRRKDATTKSIVFSQFVNFLDLIAFRLQRAGFTICRLEGTMSPQARDATIKHFMNNVHVTVFLVSLKAGGVALNLTEASRVYLMDSWWNPAVEYQAMDRIHRLGQHRPVEAIKLVVEDSIESRIVQLQEKKSAMINATLSTDDSAMGRLTPEDLGFLFRVST